MTYDYQLSAMNRLQQALAQPFINRSLNKGSRIFEKLGHDPESALRAMRGYGLCDREIARYYEITPATVRRLERFFGIDGRHW